jgi:malate dehydrogenase
MEGKYYINNNFIGVQAKLGTKGIEEVIEIELRDDESTALNKSADAVRELKEILAKMDY